MPNRVQLDIDGTVYTFPVNPIGYNPQENEQYSLKSTIDGGAVRFTPFFDDRKRVMRWRSLPNKSPYNTLIPNLRSAIGIDNVKIKHRDLDLSGDADVWRSIRVEDVNFRYKEGAGPSTATSNLAYDLDFVFTYITEVVQ
jgi:hypothetical protein